MARYQVTLSYDGTGFCGFQRQARDRKGRSLQAEFEAALSRIGWQGKSILAAGRTDAGVHAKGQVVTFDLDWRHSSRDLRAALNANLPHNMAVITAAQVGENFHPRYDALSRLYQYRLFCQETRDPLRERFSWRVWPVVDFELLQNAAGKLIGTYDFSAFGTPPRVGGTTVRQVFRSTWSKEQDVLLYEVQATAFLTHMVRRLVGFQVAVAQRKHPLEHLEQKLSGGEQPLVREMAPPNGLCLAEVHYPVANSFESDLEQN